MKRCSRCGCTSMVLIRDSVVFRRETLYRTFWFRCPDCQDVGFSMKPSHELSDVEVEQPQAGTQTLTTAAIACLKCRYPRAAFARSPGSS